MRLIKWFCDTGFHGCDRRGEIEVEDGATNGDIDDLVREEVFNFISWGWDEPAPSLPQPSNG